MSDFLILVGLVFVALGYVLFEELSSRNFHLFDDESRVFTHEDLQSYDGSNEISYTACNGVVFDVSESPHTDPQSFHHRFLGKDASLALATMNFRNQPELVEEPELATLTVKEKRNLTQWEKKYREKFKVVGRMRYIVPDSQKDDFPVA